MARIATSLAILTFALSTTVYAGTPSDVQPPPALSTNQRSAPATSVTYSSASTMMRGLASDPNVPGATGRTIVPGISSTIGGDTLATQMERTGSLGE